MSQELDMYAPPHRMVGIRSSFHQTIITLTTEPNVPTEKTITNLKTVTTNCTYCKISNILREQVNSERLSVYQPSNLIDQYQRYFK